MVTTAQVLAVLGILSAPMISITVIVLTLAALNLSLGLRKLFVRVLGFIFEYATRIKKVKEVPISANTSSDEPSSTPEPSPVIKRSSTDPIELNPEKPLLTESKSAATISETTNQDQKVSTTDIQFRLGKRSFIFLRSSIEF
jgi:uncharacterized membrane protein YraQ (UPF0718 family)